MKTSPSSPLAFTAALLALSPAFISASFAQPLSAPPIIPAMDTGRPAPTQAEVAAMPEYQPIPREREARALIGREIVGLEGERLGRLNDMALFAEDGQIVYLIVSSGTDSRAFPFSALRPEQAEKGLVLRLPVNEKTWKDTPRFDKAQLDTLLPGQPQQETLHRHFGQAIMPAGLQEQRLALVTETVGKTLRYEGRDLGKIEDVLIHLDSGISALLLNPRRGNNGALPDQKFTLPFRALAPAEDGSFSTTLSPQQFTSVHVETGSTPARSADASAAPYVWSAYGASATVLAHTNPPAPFQGRDLSASRPPVVEIRDALAADPNTRYIPVQIVAASDRVILQGVVQDEDARRRVENLVSGVSGGWIIDNRLRIASAVQE